MKLWCVDNGDPECESRYRGPFAGREEAERLSREIGGEVRRCRRLRPSEVDGWAWELTAILERRNEDVSGELPSRAWANFDEVVLRPSEPAAYVDDRLRRVDHALEGMLAWADKHLRLDAYICETDEVGNWVLAWLSDEELGPHRADLDAWLRDEMAARWAGSEDAVDPEQMVVDHVMDRIGIDESWSARLGVGLDGLVEAICYLCGRAGWPWVVKAHQDCPACPECSAPCLTTVGEAIQAGHLRCGCCGEETIALPGEVAQALAADRAWAAVEGQ